MDGQDPQSAEHGNQEKFMLIEVVDQRQNCHRRDGDVKELDAGGAEHRDDHRADRQR